MKWQIFTHNPLLKEGTKYCGLKGGQLATK